jgi:hypothetical protein
VVRTLQNGQKIQICPQLFQMAINYTYIFHSKALQNFIPNWDFRYENIRSGNPVFYRRMDQTAQKMKTRERRQTEQKRCLGGWGTGKR